jgi:glycosyltransferase involved in cell wall biosynthesis
MNILQIVPSLEAGGAERATLDIAATLQSEGHLAFVISSGGRMVDELEKSGAAHFTWNVASKNPLALIANSLSLRHFIAERAIDLVHVRSRAPAWSAYFAARMAGIPFVTTFHAAYKGNAPWKRFYNGVMTRGDAIIAISAFIARHIQEKYGIAKGKITTILRGIDFLQFDPAAVSEERKSALRQQFELADVRKLIILPGRLSPIKGQELAIEALARLKAVDFLCLIIGPDQGRTEYRETLQRKINQAGMQKKILLIPQTDLMAAYALAHLVLSPSQVAEGFGRVPVEAQAFGVPVIATALGATAETVRDNETGWLVPAGDAAALHEKIALALGLSQDARSRMGAEAMVHVRRNFNMRKMCADTLALYKKTIDGRQR